MTKSKKDTDKQEDRQRDKVNAAAANDDSAAVQNSAEQTAGEACDEAQKEAEQQKESAETKYLRLAADFQNYKRRMEKERFERYSEGKKDFASDLLPILDNFDRALAQDEEMAKDDHDRAVIEGMAMILKQFQEALSKNGVNEIEALGLDFDPNVHNAVIMEPSKKYESQKVSEVLLKGYKIGEKVIRPSMVKVAE